MQLIAGGKKKQLEHNVDYYPSSANDVKVWTISASQYVFAERYLNKHGENFVF